MLAARLLLALGLVPALCAASNSNVPPRLTIGDKLPAISLDYGFPPEKVDLAARTAGKKTIVIGLPGAFTPTWSNVQVPGYLEKQDALKAKGIAEVLVYCVNDGAVMSAWAEDQKIDGSMITFLADTRAELTAALGTVLDHEGPMSVLGNPRSKRFAIYADDGVIKAFHVSEGPDGTDPAGDDDPSASCVDAMLAAIDSSAKDEL